MPITINIWAVLAAAVVNMVVGYFWYRPLFGKMWKSLMGFTDESIKSMKLSQTQSMGLGFVTSLVTAYVLGYFVVLLNTTGLGGAWQLAFWIWLGFLATTTAGSFIWEGKPLKLFVLNVAGQLVALFLMAVVLVFWK